MITSIGGIIGYIVNGNGKPEADETTKKFDQDKYKNVGFRVMQAIGEHASIGGFFSLSFCCFGSGPF